MSESIERMRLSVGQAATLAIIREVTAPKPGNVHRAADFEDVTYLDFVQSAVIVGPILKRVPQLGIGCAVMEAVRATRDAVQTNTNLGSLLLIAPLAAVPDECSHAHGITKALGNLTFEDTRCVFEAIRMASAGGLGKVDEADVADPPPAGLSLIDAMRMASDRDLVARQYVNAFADVFRIAEWIEQGLERGWSLDASIVHAHVRQLATEPDSLVVRKCGIEIGDRVLVMAERVLDAGLPGDENYENALADFDFWLRSDGHRRNPGTTADLIAAALFVLLREGRVGLKQ